ncbi:MAG: WD40/YVTN/BNR-like repeat-containing protein [Candidatus Omnitrophota bacterium]
MSAVVMGLGFSWQWRNVKNGINDSEVICLSAHPIDRRIIFCGTARAVYKTGDAGVLWREVFSVSATGKQINDLFVEKDEVYAATGDGLFISRDAGRRWNRIFQGMGEFDRNCLSIAVFDGIIFLGTGKTLFLSPDLGRTWQRAGGAPDNTRVTDIAVSSAAAYAAVSDGVYYSAAPFQNWQRIFVEFPEDENGAESDSLPEENGATAPAAINRITIDPHNSQRIFLATQSGIIFSEDAGKGWKKFPSAGILSREVKDILISQKDGAMFCANSLGVYRFSDGKWESISAGMPFRESFALAQAVDGEIWVAGRGGVYKLEQDHLRSSAALHLRSSAFSNEPSIQELQKVAIDYAEVSAEKIKSWRRRASIKAVMPEVSLDFDRTVTTALGSTYDRAAIGPQDWGVNLKWNVGELIWNNDQTSIDSRSKLMVELRDDILNELTRLYFERRRLQMETGENSERDLRIQELTALIDGLTGGYFSRAIKQNN